MLFKNNSMKGGRQAQSIEGKKGDRALFQRTIKCSSSHEIFIWEFPQQQFAIPSSGTVSLGLFYSASSPFSRLS